MKIILLQDVSKIGRKYDTKEINDGYALNFLLPKKLAKMATPEAIVELEKSRAKIALKKEEARGVLLGKLSKIKDNIIIIKSKANEIGNLFSAIHKKEILEALKHEGDIEIDPENIILEKPIKSAGEYEIAILVDDKKYFIKIKIAGL
jgi:large subunit ribosomal protein L9